MFSLHPELVKNCVVVGDLPLCRVLLDGDSNYPWLILVPRRADVREAFQLEPEDQQQLLVESNLVAAKMNAYFNADKMNVAALGNQVPQLHIHHVVRYKNDPAWPGPIWGAVAKKPYTEEQTATRLAELRKLLAEGDLQF